MDAALFDTIRSFKLTSRKQRVTDDDFTDRLNHYYSTLLICIFSILICAKQYLVGEPLQCWVPKEFSDGWEQYAENYCWVKNTYFVSPKHDLPEYGTTRREAEIQYYQWVPFVLALQALLFYLPNMFWRLLNWQTGIPIRSLVEKANDVDNVKEDKRKANLDLLVRHIKYSLIDAPDKKPGLVLKVKHILSRLLCCGYRKSGNYLICLFLVTKLLYLCNLLLQFVIMNSFLHTKYHMHGFQILRDIVRGRDWSETGHFPRVTYCDFNVRDVGQVRPYTVQCVLVINMFNEKVYIFLWFWFTLVFAATAASLIAWLLWLVWPNRLKMSIGKYLEEDHGKEAFIKSLKPDGVFVLKLMGINSGEVVMHDLVQQLYANYVADHPQFEPAQSPNERPSSSLPPTHSVTSGSSQEGHELATLPRREGVMV